MLNGSKMLWGPDSVPDCATQQGWDWDPWLYTNCREPCSYNLPFPTHLPHVGSWMAVLNDHCHLILLSPDSSFFPAPLFLPWTNCRQTASPSLSLGSTMWLTVVTGMLDIQLDAAAQPCTATIVAPSQLSETLEMNILLFYVTEMQCLIGWVLHSSS